MRFRPAAFALLALTLRAGAAVVMLEFEDAGLRYQSSATGGLELITENVFLLEGSLSAGGAGMKVVSAEDTACVPPGSGAHLAVPWYSRPVLRSLAGEPFSIVSMDIAGYSCLLGTPSGISLFATRMDGSAFLWQAPDNFSGFGFQTVTLPESFTMLRSVQWRGDFSVDNIVLSVPEPRGLVLLMIIVVTLRRPARLRSRG